ncbi:hypothetical protein HMPREF9069_01336 [Atopobium sp. oral taxon 810 str. F0209]|nr:hypothetical protein HMPREF9069_01336 [Atopobium sp. oral taxon 810 str. F0209]
MCKTFQTQFLQILLVQSIGQPTKAALDMKIWAYRKNVCWNVAYKTQHTLQREAATCENGSQFINFIGIGFLIHH